MVDEGGAVFCVFIFLTQRERERERERETIAAQRRNERTRASGFWEFGIIITGVHFYFFSSIFSQIFNVSFLERKKKKKKTLVIS
jgi:hypothetical protein